LTERSDQAAWESRSEPQPLPWITLALEYAGGQARLSYAASAYGAQGATVGAARTVPPEATSAAGVSAGMTPGRRRNRRHDVVVIWPDGSANQTEWRAPDMAPTSEPEPDWAQTGAGLERGMAARLAGSGRVRPGRARSD
jgi:hypothetical protein